MTQRDGVGANRDVLSDIVREMPRTTLRIWAER